MSADGVKHQYLCEHWAFIVEERGEVKAKFHSGFCKLMFWSIYPSIA